MDKEIKIFAIVAAVMMLAVAGIAIVGASELDASSTDITNGSVHVRIVDGRSQDGVNVSKTVSAYDGAIALDTALNTALSSPIAHVMDMRTSYYQVTGTDGDGEPIYSSYPTINTSYGAITSINNLSNGTENSWHVYCLNPSNQWVAATQTLGFYKPFADYNVNFQTANIAVYYGTDSAAETYRTNLSTTPVATIIGTSDIINNDNFRVTFYFKVNMTEAMQTYMTNNNIQFSVAGCNFTVADLSNGVTVNGFGSDLYTALKQVVGDNVSAEEGVPGTTYTSGSYSSYNSYSWLNSLFGVNSFQLEGADTPNDWSDDVWAWWTQYSAYTVLGDTSNVVSDYVLGYYSPVAGAPNTDVHYAFVFSAGGV